MSRRENMSTFLPLAVKLIAIGVSLTAIYLIASSLVGSRIEVEYENSTIPITIGNQIPENATLLFYGIIGIIATLTLIMVILAFFGPRSRTYRRRR